ncbi:MAG: nitrite reductase [Tepidibacter sp.]|jgi:NAD(P)H-nitrite reductase large subunit|uniref:nitrite reductase n=1 Tax=Tepidibacter sp. TaxID=2529387 RepID=UPI0025E19626|nr:nitrite reductase [Tepidibacter sp.]MCT4507711.1 nitrite reductase [Tepidibacter sp.]
MGKAIFKQINGSFALVLASDCGVISVENLCNLSCHLKKMKVPVVKLSSRQTLVVIGSIEQLQEVEKIAPEFGFKIGNFGSGVRNVKGCSAGEGLCKRQLDTALNLGIELENEYFGIETPHDFKISVAGCTRGCTDPLCADFGVITNGKDKFDVYIGGRGATIEPVHATKIYNNISRGNVKKALKHVLDIYIEQGNKKERIFKTINRIGLEKFVHKDIEENKKQHIDEEFLAFI